MTVMITLLTISSFFNSIPAGLWALLGTIVGSVGLRLLEKWLNRNKEQNEVRRDLNVEIKDLQTRLDLVETEVSEWRKRAYAAEEAVAKLRIMLIKYGEDLALGDGKETQQ